MRCQTTFFANGPRSSDTYRQVTDIFTTPAPSSGNKRRFGEIDDEMNEENLRDPPALSYHLPPSPGFPDTASAHHNGQTLMTKEVLHPFPSKDNININDNVPDDVSDEEPLVRKVSSRVPKLPTALADYVTAASGDKKTDTAAGRDKKLRNARSSRRGGNRGGASSSSKQVNQ